MRYADVLGFADELVGARVRLSDLDPFAPSAVGEVESHSSGYLTVRLDRPVAFGSQMTVHATSVERLEIDRG